MKQTVSIVTYEKPFESVAKAINLSGAFDRLQSTDRVFVKPNIVFLVKSGFDASMGSYNNHQGA